LSGAKLRVFGHNDLDDLERILQWADKVHRPESDSPNSGPRTLIVTESVFSMDGDRAPLREIVALKEQFGAWLMVDEAHATGLYGRNRRGLAEELDVSDRIEVQMGTLGKALGAAGGYICGSRPLIDYLVNRARSFIFSTAPVPAAAAAATAGVGLVASEEGRAACARVWMRVDELKRALQINGLNSVTAHGAITPFLVGAEQRALELSRQLLAQNFFVPAIRYPTVPKGKARLRFTVTAEHESTHVGNVIKRLKELVG
jgi:glycine C-acetyltransferase/8-amino-7-oxononanoate synthase